VEFGKICRGKMVTLQITVAPNNLKNTYHGYLWKLKIKI